MIKSRGCNGGLWPVKCHMTPWNSRNLDQGIQWGTKLTRSAFWEATWISVVRVGITRSSPLRNCRWAQQSYVFSKGQSTQLTTMTPDDISFSQGLTQGCGVTMSCNWKCKLTTQIFIVDLIGSQLVLRPKTMEMASF